MHDWTGHIIGIDGRTLPLGEVAEYSNVFLVQNHHSFSHLPFFSHGLYKSLYYDWRWDRRPNWRVLCRMQILERSSSPVKLKRAVDENESHSMVLRLNAMPFLLRRTTFW